MALVSIANLVFSYGDRVVLDGVNLTLERGERVGLVGRNGCGKSTLLKIVAGLNNLKPLSGQVQLARGASVGYLAQDFELNPDHTLREEAGLAFAHVAELTAQLEQLAHDMADAQGDALDKLLKRYEQVEHQIEAAGGAQVDHLVDETLHHVGLTDDLFGVKVADLSGGQKGRLALAKLLLSRPDVLLLDEPTNHLDIEGRRWLEQYLLTYPGAVLLISHDRWLLDVAVNRICEMELGQLVMYPGNYGKFRELRAERRVAQQREYEKQQTRIKSEQAFIDRYRAGQRAKQAQGREKRLERFVRDEAKERPIELSEVSIRFGAATRAADVVITAEHLGMQYETRKLFDGVDATIKRGEIVGVIGPNGAGKSTLVRCMLNEQDPTSGQSKLGASVQVGFYRQTHEHLDLSLTVVDYLRRFVSDGTEQSARDLAGAFLFSGDDQDKQMSVLSGGERSRAVLAGLIASGPNLLVLDEPTNHLDIPSAERLEDALKSFVSPPTGFGQNKGFPGTLILITHDRMLLDMLADRLLAFDGRGHVRDFPGGYRDYLAAQQQEEAAAAPPTRKSPPTKPTPSLDRPRSGPGASGDKPKNKGPKSPLARHSIEDLEKRIVTTEKQLAEVDTKLADPAVYRDAARVRQLQQDRQRLRDELTPLEEEWQQRG